MDALVIIDQRQLADTQRAGRSELPNSAWFKKSSPTSLNAEEVAAVADRFQKLATRIEAFLSSQLRRIDEALQLSESKYVFDATAKRAANELEEERQRWEQQRQKECEQVRQQQQLLVDAWENLEAEQRQLLFARNSMKISDDGDAHDVAVKQAPLSHATAVAEDDLNRSQAQGDNSSAEPTSVQFQQLKREIRRHVRRGQWGT